jgi:hypothetical protein
MNKWIKQHVGIVSEDKVHKAVAYLSEHPHPYALARYEELKAENSFEETWATVYGEQEGSIENRKAATNRNQRVVAARQCIAEAKREVESHRQRINAANSLISIFQTESANTRNVGNLR